MASTCALLAALLLPLFIQYTSQSTPADDFYIAAVVEYKGFYENKTDKEILMSNVEQHIKLIAEAAKSNTDIIVFPELGLLSYGHSEFIEVPDPANKTIPATCSTCHEALRALSQAAIANNIYVVTNLHELYKSNSIEYRYNTNIVFDRKGTLIARYRKYNLFGENYLNRTETPEFVTFETDFGVTFGTFICFDIVFENPAVGLVRDKNITNIVYSTAWYSELPLHTAIQEQNAWAYANNVNLLASGLNYVKKGNTGSGIYAGNAGPIVYTQTELEGTQLLIARVAKKPGSKDGKVVKNSRPLNDTKEETISSKILQESLNEFSTFLLKPETLNQTKENNISMNTSVQGLQRDYEMEQKLCDKTNSFCCNFNLKFTAKYYPNEFDFNKDDTFKKSDAYYHYRYRLIAFDGIRKYIVDDTTGQQLCAIIPCLNDTLESCGKANLNTQPSVKLNGRNLTLFSTEFTLINITSEFHNNRVLFLPSILLSSDVDNKTSFGKLPAPDQFKFNINEAKSAKTHVSLEIQPKVNDEAIRFASGGILARVFERDNKPNSANLMSIHTLVWCLIPIILYLYRNR